MVLHQVTNRLKKCLGFSKVLKNEIDDSLAPIETDEDGYGQARPIHILDMAN